jgi:hypothetical protein
MADEIRPVRISMPRRVGQVSRENREENDERFRKVLAEAGGEEKPAPRREDRRDASPPEQPPAGTDQEPPEVGRHLDLRT